MISAWQELFYWVLASSIMGSLLIGLILMVKYLVKDRLGPRWHYFIWFLLLIRLLMPILPSTPLSLYNFIPLNMVKTGFTADFDFRWLERFNTRNSLTLDNSSVIIQSPPEGTGIEILSLLSWIYLTVVVILAVRTAITEIRFRVKVKRACKVSDVRLLNIFEACKIKLGIKNATIWETEFVRVPVLYGLTRPRLLMPVNLPNQLNSRQLTHIFLHELCHLKHKDIAVNWLITILRIIHWFNPLLWYAFKRMEEDQELACDALTLQHLESGTTKDYAHTIIRVLEILSQPPALPSTVGIISNQSLNKIRIAKIILHKRTSSLKWKVVGLAVAFLLSIVSLTNAVGMPQTTASEQSSLKVLEREQVLSSPAITSTSTPDSTVYGYVQARFTRSTEQMLAVMTKDLANKTGLSKFLGPSFGQSSPWVERAQISGKKRVGQGVLRYQVKYWLATSTGPAGTQIELVEVKKVNDEYRVSYVEEKRSQGGSTKN